MTDDGKPGVAEALDEALMETHHLANISGLDEARVARRRLVEAQSASSVGRTRDLLNQAIEYLELAKLERRDTAAGFVQARELVAYAEAGLQREQPVPLTGSPAELVRSADPDPEPDHRSTLQELRAERAVTSFEQLQYDVKLDDTFRELQRLINEGEIEHEPADEIGSDVETALEAASLEMEIERSIQRPGDGSEFEFLDSEDIEGAEEGESSDPTDEPIATPDGEEPAGTDDEPIAMPDGDELAPGDDDSDLEFDLDDAESEDDDEGDAVAGGEEA